MAADTTFDEVTEDQWSDTYEGDSQPTKTVTLREVLAAVRANGLPHIRGIWFDVGAYNQATNTYALNGGCAVAQAARNLGVDPHYLENEDVITAIINLNDGDYNLTLDQIATRIEETYADDLDKAYVTHVADYTNGVPAYVYERLAGA